MKPTLAGGGIEKCKIRTKKEVPWSQLKIVVQTHYHPTNEFTILPVLKLVNPLINSQLSQIKSSNKSSVESKETNYYQE